MSDHDAGDRGGTGRPEEPAGSTVPPSPGGEAIPLGPTSGPAGEGPTSGGATGGEALTPTSGTPGGSDAPPAEAPGSHWWTPSEPSPPGAGAQEAEPTEVRSPTDPPTWPGADPGQAPGPYGYGGWGYPGQAPGPYGYGGWGPPPGGWGPPPGGGWGPAGHGPSGRPGRVGRRVLAVVLSVATAVAVLLGIGIGYTVWSGSATRSNAGSSLGPRSGIGGTTSSGSTSSGSTGPRNSSAAGSPSDISTIASKVDPELVDINTQLGYQTGSAAGTGMVLTSNGLVLTNNHVIEGATKIDATDIGNGKTYRATVVGYDRTLDVAVIQLQGASGLQTVTTRTSSPSIGEAVVGIGNAGGLGGTPSTAGGQVVGLNQSITASDEADSTTEHLTGLIETNAHIEAGDSGGPLVDTSGRVIGMDTAASSSQGFTFRNGATGDGYAIPISTAVSTAKQIESGNGTSTIHIGATAFLGVRVRSVGQVTLTAGTTGFRGQTRFFGGRTGTATRTTGTTGSNGNLPSSGAYVTQALSGDPAAQAGLAHGDVITKLGNTAVTSPNSLSSALVPYHPGDRVSVTWVDSSGQQHSATVQLSTGPAA